MAVAPPLNRYHSDEYLHVVPSLMRTPSLHPTYPAPPYYSSGRPPIYSPEPASGRELRIEFPPPIRSTRSSSTTNTTVTEIYGLPQNSFSGQMSSSQRVLRELREDKHLLHEDPPLEKTARYLFWLGFVLPLLWAIGSLLLFLRPGEDRSTVWVDAVSHDVSVESASTESLT
ncbi:hypothetical protein FRC09_016902, partial [Ceratobasidium sp. 395]